MSNYDSPGYVAHYPGGTAPQGTGAPGTPGITAAETAGPEIGRPTVTDPNSSSQAPQPTVPVLAGDTCSLSSDSPVPASDPLTGIPREAIVSMGPHTGYTDPYPHQNASGRQG